MVWYVLKSDVAMETGKLKEQLELQWNGQLL